MAEQNKKSNSFEHLGDIVLTGDRPSGRLHIGHYAGSIQKRLEFQDKYDHNFIMIADMQALTDHAAGGEAVSQSVMQLAIDYLAVGLDPAKSTIFIQSLVPELTELTVLYMNFVSLARLKRNPTVKNEMQQKGFGDTVPIGFLNYPVSQAADITAFVANLVPVGNDQLPMIEQTNEIVRSINYTYKAEVLRECEAIVSKTGRLPGTDGAAKMSKTVGNCIYLSDDEKTVKEKVMGMFTDPGHLRVEDPGKVEGNPVFTYLKTFDPDQDLVQEMADHYQRGGLGDVKVKKHLLEVMQDLLTPIRTRRAEYEQEQDQILKMLKENSAKASAIAHQTLTQLKQVMSLDY